MSYKSPSDEFVIPVYKIIHCNTVYIHVLIQILDMTLYVAILDMGMDIIHCTTKQRS